MRIFFIIVLLSCLNICGYSQKEKEIRDRMESLHDRMVNKVGYHYVVEGFLDDSLSYGHSNGWIETKSDFISHLTGRIITYHSIKEDSVSVVVNGNVAHIRFIGDYDVTLNEKRAVYHLKVLEVWVKKGKKWLLFARQAVK